MTNLPAKILIVDDEVASRSAISDWLRADGFEVLQAANGREAVERLYDGVSLVVTDLKMPRVDGMELLKIVRERVPHVAVVMLTGSATVATAIQALQLGAYDYLVKPVNLPELTVKIRRAIDQQSMTLEIAELHAKLKNRDELYKMIGRGDNMRKVFERIRMVAGTTATVLITGESGTGKELVARAIHAHSPRCKRPFLPVNFAAISESLIESELFGHEAGSFTGANKKRDGVFQAADGGTLFLDEIGDLQTSLQSNLLRALENKTIIRVGSQREESIDVRMVAATNCDLRKKVSDGSFREDLFYRLNVVNVELPPLREREADIPLIAQYFLETIAREYERSVTGFSRSAMKIIEDYNWPGNVRELRNVIESIVVMSLKPQVEADDLPEYITGAPTKRRGMRSGMSLQEVEKEVIINTLVEHDWVRKESAAVLGISVRTLQRKLKEYEIEPEESVECSS